LYMCGIIIVIIIIVKMYWVNWLYCEYAAEAFYIVTNSSRMKMLRFPA